MSLPAQVSVPGDAAAALLLPVTLGFFQLLPADDAEDPVLRPPSANAHPLCQPVLTVSEDGSYRVDVAHRDGETRCAVM